MEKLDAVLSRLDEILDTRSKQHMAGGILISISLLFGGLAITVMTIKREEKCNERYIE